MPRRAAKLDDSRKAAAGRRPSRPVAGNRRTRIGDHVGAQLRGWLQRVTRAHATLCHVVRVYGAPERAGGASNAGNVYVERAASGDPTLLHDALGAAIDTLAGIRAEVSDHMDQTRPCRGKPGSAAKVEEMARRAAAGHSIFNSSDRIRE